jgi:restriction endonuclease S subunit
MLKKIAALTTSIKYGPHFKTVYSGSVRYLKAQHFDGNNGLSEIDDSYADPTAKLEPHLLNEGQLILAGKGNRHLAWAYRTAAGPCIASSLFYVLSVRTEVVDPRFLALLLNSASCVRALTAIAKGASVPVIPKRELTNLKVNVPSKERQQRAIRLHELQTRRRELMTDIATLTTTLDEAYLERFFQSNA